MSTERDDADGTEDEDGAPSTPNSVAPMGWRDYVAIVLALGQTVLLPILLAIAVLVLFLLISLIII